MAYITTTYNEFALTGTSPVSFTFELGGNTIYSGKGWARPGQSTVYVRPNDVFSQYLSQTFPTLSNNTSTDCDVVKTFNIVSGSSASKVYCLGSMADLDNSVHHAPITGRVQTGQFFITSVFKSSTKLVTSAGTTTLSTANKNRATDTSSLTGSIQVKMGTDTVTWQLVPKCHRFVLYYVNAFGGWDSLVCEGGYRLTDTYERAEAGVWPAANGQEAKTRTSKVYLNEVTRSVVLNSGWLTDAQAARMHHLLGSTLVYLCDTDDSNAVYPVKITNGDCPYKTFKNEGGQMVNYEITAEFQTTITRR